jgi:hypothetical protein
MARRTNAPKVVASSLRETVQLPASQGPKAANLVRTTATRTCDDCRADTAFHAWRSFQLPASFNMFVDFDDWHLIPKGKRAVIELVTAQILVPAKEWVRLRMYTSLGSDPSNLDLFVNHQGDFQGQVVYVATHSLRAYTDNTIEFDINRDNATTTGSGLICVSGYIAN